MKIKINIILNAVSPEEKFLLQPYLVDQETYEKIKKEYDQKYCNNHEFGFCHFIINHGLLQEHIDWWLKRPQSLMYSNLVKCENVPIYEYKNLECMMKNEYSIKAFVKREKLPKLIGTAPPWEVETV